MTKRSAPSARRISSSRVAPVQKSAGAEAATTHPLCRIGEAEEASVACSVSSDTNANVMKLEIVKPRSLN